MTVDHTHAPGREPRASPEEDDMANPGPTLATQAAPLLRFRAAFAPPRTTFTREGGAYLAYDHDVAEFFRLVGQPPWVDTGYSPTDAGRLVEDPAACARATLDELRGAFTWIWRSERFGDGAWAAALKAGWVSGSSTGSPRSPRKAEGLGGRWTAGPGSAPGVRHARRAGRTGARGRSAPTRA